MACPAAVGKYGAAWLRVHDQLQQNAAALHGGSVGADAIAVALQRRPATRCAWSTIAPCGKNWRAARRGPHLIPFIDCAPSKRMANKPRYDTDQCRSRCPGGTARSDGRITRARL